ncbi:MAG TPA: nitrilase-related carbon-nitrogen hydrolase, partial [Xanthobacteraceae bacterium]|nr:nitrilase-related carbon-nitrogen hydrolase [Xanthobacteraceae bacterium]
MTRREPFNSIYSQGFLRAAVCAPKVALASPERNLEETLKLAEQASLQEAALAAFPELGVTGYSNDDLFFQDA